MYVRCPNCGEMLWAGEGLPGTCSYCEPKWPWPTPEPEPESPPPVCECGAEKSGISYHFDWCPKGGSDD